MLTDGTRIYYDNISTICILRERVSHIREHASYSLTVCLILLTTEGVDKILKSCPLYLFPYKRDVTGSISFIDV